MSFLRYLFTRRNVQPKGALLVTTDNALFVDVYSLELNSIWELRGRLLRPQGDIALLRMNFPAQAGTGAAQRNMFPLLEGMLLGVTVVGTNTLGGYGKTFARISLGSGVTATPLLSQVLAEDYCGANFGPVWPGGRGVQPPEKRGLYRRISAAPGAGNDVLDTAPNNLLRSYEWITFVLTTSLAAGNRQVVAAVRDFGGAFLWAVNFPAVQAPNTTFRYNLYAGAAYAVFGNTMTLPLPFTPIPLQGSFGTVTTGLDVADQFTQVQFGVNDQLVADL